MSEQDEYQEPVYRVENGLYVFYLNGGKRFETPEVALLFDEGSTSLLTHGRPEMVQAAATRMRTQYLAAGLTDMARDLVVVSGKFDAADLSGVVQTADNIGELYTRLKATAN